MNAQYPDHPAASLMPNMTEEEFQALKADIKQHGLREPILIFNGHVVDGRHRLRACRDLGIKPQVKELTCRKQDLASLVRSLNFHRRHLTREQKQAIIRQQLKETPNKSDRQIAKELGVSNQTVSIARNKMVAEGQLCESHSSVGADGKARKRPVAGVDPDLLESLESTGKMADVLALIKKHKIPEKFHKDLIEKAQEWAPNSEAADRERTSISVRGATWWYVASGQAAQDARRAKMAAFRRRTRNIKIEEFAAKYHVELGEIIKKADALAPFANQICKDTLKAALVERTVAVVHSMGKLKEGVLRPPVGEKEIRTESPALEYLPPTLDEGDNAPIPF